MSDILNIRVTERELDLIMDLLHEAGERPDADGNPAIELCHDLMEQSGRSAEIEPTEIAEGSTFTVAEDDFINAGIQAREQAKATSMAADRRAMRFTRSDTDEREPSEQQRVDIWDRPNDPLKW
tara:strand:+ start:1462 stop:1833 length:372 start_codon:yes stop_codon:yes gene_type:complete